MAPRVRITSKTRLYVEPEPVVDNKDRCFDPLNRHNNNTVWDLSDWDIPDSDKVWDLSNWDFV